MLTSPTAIGLLLALAALVFWSLTPFFFAATGRLIGPFATNLLRLSLAAPVMAGACVVFFFADGGDLTGFPAPANVVVLAASGILGLAFGDLFLYRSLFRVGPERSSLLLTLSPAAAALIAWFALRETLSPAQLGGMALILGGVMFAVWTPAAAPQTGGKAGAPSSGTPAQGFWYGAAAGMTAAACQALSSVMARHAFLAEPGLSPLYATTVRLAAAAAMMLVIARFRGVRFAGMRTALRTPRVWPRLLGGTIAGPIAGMTCYIAAMKYQPAGVVVTITFMTPLLVMPLGAWRYGTRIGYRASLGAAAALAGIVLLGLVPA